MGCANPPDPVCWMSGGALICVEVTCGDLSCEACNENLRREVAELKEVFPLDPS